MTGRRSGIGVPAQPVRSLELFSCTGGMAAGFRTAGIEFDLAIDHSPEACDAYEQNLGRRPICIGAVDFLRIVNAAPASFDPIELVVAEPPCAHWSRAGSRRGLGDSRCALGITAALLERLEPRAWLLGNVPGLDDAPNPSAFHATLGQLERHYCIDYASLDAAAYGVPQHRVRPFWFGHPHGTSCIQWPRPTHGALHKQLQVPGTELLPCVTVRQALAHLTPAELGRPVRVRDRRTRASHPPTRLDHPAGTITTGSSHRGGNVLECASAPELLTHAKHPISRADAPSYVITTKGDGRGAQGGCVVEWPWERPSTTVHSDPRVAAPGHHVRARLRAPNAIKLSERAAAVLQGFPEGWRFVGRTKAARRSQIGQADPPALAAAVARSVVRWLGLESEPAELDGGAGRPWQDLREQRFEVLP